LGVEKPCSVPLYSSICQDLGGTEVLDQLIDLLQRGDRIFGAVQDEETALARAAPSKLDIRRHLWNLTANVLDRPVPD
jgi:hypothetical protein